MEETPGTTEQAGASTEQPAEQGRPAVALREAAARSGLSVQALRQRIQRGKLSRAVVHDGDGRLIVGVYLDELHGLAGEVAPPEQAGAKPEQASETPTDELPAAGPFAVELFQDHVRDLRDQLQLAAVRESRLLGQVERMGEERRLLLKAPTGRTGISKSNIGILLAALSIAAVAWAGWFADILSQLHAAEGKNEELRAQSAELSTRLSEVGRQVDQAERDLEAAKVRAVAAFAAGLGVRALGR